MIASKNQNQFSSFFAPLGDLLKALMFLSNLNGFNSSPSPPVQEFAKQKGSSKVWKEKGFKWFYHFFSLLFLFLFALLVCFVFIFWVSLVLCFVLFNIFLFVFSFCLFCFSYKKKIEKSEKIQKIVCVLCILILVCHGWPLKQSFLKFCIFCNLDVHLYAQPSNWVLWLVFVMSKIK